ncbi:MAG: M23 family metallopeptidase [Bacteroidetes bacterium]|nr:M23 family metallopeptidase [Bacteroidota bacterium]
MIIKKALLSFVLISFCLVSFGQKKAGFFQNLFKSKATAAPEITLNPDLYSFLTTEFDSSGFIDFNPNAYLNTSISNEVAGPLIVVREFGIPVQVMIDLEIDSIWLSADDYYSIWDSKKVNPYDLDGEKFADTLQVQLFDTINNFHWRMPITNTYPTSAFGLRRSRWHYGTDLKLQIGDTVRSAFDGIVRMTQYDRYGYGNYVLVRHYNGLETLYGHLSKSKVEVGQEVKAGELIGLGGNTGRSTGSHLHFEVRYQGNAIDPTSMYDFDSDSLLSMSFEINPATFSYLTEARKIRLHRIRSGDTLSHIAMWYGVPIRTLCRLNHISTRSILRVGRQLRVN